MAVRPSLFEFASREFEPCHVRFSFFYPPFAFESQVFFCFLFSLQFKFTLFCLCLGCFPFFLLYVYRVPAPSEHMLDPQCFVLYSPLTREFEPCHIIAFLLFYFYVLFSSPVCVRVSTFFFFLQFYVTFFYVELLPVFLFYMLLLLFSHQLA